MSVKRSHEDVSKAVFVYKKDTDPFYIPSDITSLLIDSSVKEIPSNAFHARRSLVDVEYSEGLEVIGKDSFHACQRLQKQQFPLTLVEIGSDAFQECRQLESVGDLPLSLNLIADSAFICCAALQGVEIPNPACRLGIFAFAGCSSLTHARLPGGLKIIPEGLFSCCISLMDVKVPFSVIEIADRAFSRCERLATIELPTGLKSIGMEALSRTALKHFRFPPTVETIGPGALSNCRELESVILPPKLDIVPKEAFKNCKKLKDVSIPKSVSSVGDSAFADCGLTHLDLSQCILTSVGRFAVARCAQLKSVLLPMTGLKRIEARTFDTCSSITHLWIPPTVEYIDNGAFADCISLLSIEVPERLKQVRFVGRCPSMGELCGYKSLVNLCLPPSNTTEAFEDYYFMDDMKLGVAVDGYRDLLRKLKVRFSSSPLHRACYFQSYHALQDNMERIQNIMKADPAACDQVDFVGMSPFHILALSQWPCLELFQELLSVPTVDIMRCRDFFGCTPLDYLCKNHSTRAVCVTKSLLLSISEPRISFLGLDRWRDEVKSGLETVQMANSSSIGAEVASFFQKLAEYEWMEVLSLLEMAVWNMKLEDEKITCKDSRESCRVNCGSGIVLTNVLPFLDRGTA